MSQDHSAAHSSEGWDRLLTALNLDVESAHVEPGDLASFAELSASEGRQAADSTFPLVAAHLAEGCDECAGDLWELRQFIRDGRQLLWNGGARGGGSEPSGDQVLGDRRGLPTAAFRRESSTITFGTFGVSPSAGSPRPNTQRSSRRRRLIDAIVLIILLAVLALWVWYSIHTTPARDRPLPVGTLGSAGSRISATPTAILDSGPPC